MISRSTLHTTLMLDFYQVMVNVDAHVRQEDIEALKLTDVMTNDFEPALKIFDEVMKPIYKSGLTTDIIFWDEERDRMIVGARKHLKATMLNPDKEVAAAAETLLEVMDNYGKSIQRKPMREETGIITNLLQDYAKPEYLPLVEKSGVKPYTTKMGEYNSKVEEVYNSRTRIQAAIEVGVAKEARQNMQKAFSKLVKTINANAFLNGEEPYQRLMDNINQEVKQALTTVALRKKSGDTQKQEK